MILAEDIEPYISEPDNIYDLAGNCFGLLSEKIANPAKFISKRQILMRSDTKLPQPFASWSNSL